MVLRLRDRIAEQCRQRRIGIGHVVGLRKLLPGAFDQLRDFQLQQIGKREVVQVASGDLFAPAEKSPALRLPV